MSAIKPNENDVVTNEKTIISLWYDESTVGDSPIELQIETTDRIDNTPVVVKMSELDLIRLLNIAEDLLNAFGPVCVCRDRIRNN